MVFSQERIRVEDVSKTAYRAALIVDGHELLRGNRSRMVFLAGSLAERIGSLRGDLKLEVVTRVVAPRSTLLVPWEPRAPLTLWFAACFGGVTLSAVELAGMRIATSGFRNLLLAPDAGLRLVLRNAQGAAATACCVLAMDVARRP